MTDLAAAQEFIKTAGFKWYQSFPLAPGVMTPGGRDVDWILQRCNLPGDLRGQTVLDIGTTNGGVSFAAEQLGAERVVAVDIYPQDFFGFAQIKQFLGSRAEFIQASIYDLPTILTEQFDIVFFLGVLYHLRHPLLALDNLRLLTRGAAYLETAIADAELDTLSGLSVARFYRRNELAGDASNWFAPTITCLKDWCSSCGFEPGPMTAWPEGQPSRCLLRLDRSPGQPEYSTISYERPLRCALA